MSTAIIGTGSIGSALARRVLARGSTPWLIGRNVDKLEALSKELGCCRFSVVDVANPESIGDALGKAPQDLTGFAYCAGDIVLKPLRRASAADFRACFDLHVIGAAEALKSVEPELKKNGGAVCFFSSVAVQQGFTNHAVVSSAKGAIEGLTRALAAELAPKVRVNAVAPSISNSAMAQPMLGREAMAQALAKAHPLGRVGEADDSAALASFLLSPDAAWITGQVIGVDGGRAAVA
jgi:NAD(P)-dependent dehydrogenase (short-subunit alcohol dehydrogenase family)